MICSRLYALNQKIRDLERISHCPPNTVQLLAVSKAQTTDSILEAYQAGQKAFGENYVQEALTKIEVLKNYNLEWHFIGRLQSNKTNLIAEHFSWVHGVCSAPIAERLSRARPTHLGPLNICIQVNINQEGSKAGVHLADLKSLAQQINTMAGLRLRGLMTILRTGLNPNQQRHSFRELKLAQQELRAQGFSLDTLSMGMSSDYPAAIAEGATLVRIGSAIFGERA